MLLKDALLEYGLATAELKPKTQHWHDQILGVFLAWCKDTAGVADLDRLEPSHLRLFMAELKATPSARTAKPLTPNTLHGYAQVVKGWLRWCYQEGLLDKDIAVRLAMPKVEQKVIRVFSPEQIKRLYAATEAEPSARLVARDRAVLGLLLDTGIRASELVGLRTQDVHLDPRSSFIRVRGKGLKQREVGLASRSGRLDLARYVDRWRNPGSEANTQVILGRSGSGLTVYGLDAILNRLEAWAGVEHFQGIRVSAHTFRHTFAVGYLQAGGDIFALSRLLGHTTIVTTQIYLRDYAQRTARGSGLSVLDSLLA